MPLTLTDSSTWEASTLDTPEGPVTYWVLADWDAYYEQYADDDNLTRVQLAVGWADALTFKRYALGVTEYTPGLLYFHRYNPLPNPYVPTQYLQSLRKVKVLPGVASTGPASFHYADPLVDNWPNLETTDGMPPRIVYEAVFRNLPYDVQDQDAFITAGGIETSRNVIRTKRVSPRERKVPSFGFEVTVGATTTPIPEVGFLPFYDYELYHTWTRVPRDRVPDTAIAECLLKANAEAFGYNPLTGTFDKYQEGDLVFKGLAKPIEPYRGPNGEWLADVPYVFGYQPADGTGDGMLKVPYYSATDGQIWVQPKVRGSTDKYLYTKTSFAPLFEPEPG